MTQPARIQPPPHPVDGDPDGTGTRRIQGRAGEPMLPPSSGETEDYSLEALGALVEARSLPPLPTPHEDERGAISGVYSSDGGGTDEELSDLSRSLEPFYRGYEADAERAALDVRDLSLLPGNPFVGSALQPPPPRPFPWARLSLGIGAVVALGLGALAASTLWAPGHAPARQVEAVAPPQPLPAATQVPAATVEPEVVAEAAVEAPAAAMASAVEDVAAQEPEAQRTAPPAAAEPTQAKAPAAPEPAREQPAPRAANAIAPAATAGEALAALLGEPARDVPEATRAAPPAPVAPAAPQAVLPAAAPADTSANVAPAATAPLGLLPSQPARADVVKAVEASRALLQQCAGGRHGIVKLDLTVRGSGRVSSALINGVFKGTPEGSCMARAMRKAPFPQFSDPKLTLSFPVSL